MSIQNLVGAAKATSDIVSTPREIRYSHSTTVVNGGHFRQTFPKMGDGSMVDCRSIRMRFTLDMVSTDAACCVDSLDVRSIMSTMRVISGSTTLVDMQDLPLLFSLESAIYNSVHDSTYSRSKKGQETLAARQARPLTDQEYIVDLMPRGTLLNSDVLLPLDTYNDLHVDIQMAAANDALYSATDATPSFAISNVEILCDYITSASISSYMAANPVSFHCDYISLRSNSILTQQYLLRLESSSTSLNSVLTANRLVSRLHDVSVQGKNEVFFSGVNRVDYNVRINQVRLYEQNIDSLEQTWDFFSDVFPDVEMSEHFDDYATTQNVICTRLTAVHKSFEDSIISGKKTAAHNSAVIMEVQLSGAPAPLQSSSFLRSSVWIYADPRSKDLQIRE